MQRIMILGCPGSGKSTLAKQLGERLGIGVTFTDQVRFLPGWRQRGEQEIRDTMLEIQARDRWIIDGSLSAGVMDNRIKRADTFIFLDFSRWLCMLRIFNRTIMNFGKERPDMPKGCNERFEVEFFRWTWNWKHAARDRTIARMEQAQANAQIIRLQNRQQVASFLENISRENLKWPKDTGSPAST